MPWFRLDDSAYDHPKVAGLSDPAFRLWVTAGLYSCRHLTDGMVTQVTLRILQAKAKHCQELVMAGLWVVVPDGGYRFHDWEHYQPSAESVRQRRAKDRDKKARARGAANRHPDTGRFT